MTNVSLSTWVPEAVFDRLAHLASRRIESLSALTRAVLTRVVTKGRSDDDHG